MIFNNMVVVKAKVHWCYSSLTLVDKTPELETIWGYMVKKISAHGECLGSKRRRKTWQPAKSPGELATSIDPRISEWGNPIGEILSS